MFPDNFVRALKKQQPPPPPPMKAKKEAKQLHMALFDYEAANADEISFKEGQMIEFINELEEGWATGKLIDSSKVGHYPTNFVESQPQLSSSTTTPTNAARSTTPTSAEKSSGEYYAVAFEYKADNRDELDLQVGDTIKIVTKTTADDGWWEGENANGRRGVFPKNFLESKPTTAPATPSAAAATCKPIEKIKPMASVMIRPTAKQETMPQRPVSEFYPSKTPSQENIIDTKAQQSRPRGPRNKRPPNPANRRQKAEQGQSPIEDNPPIPAGDKDETPIATPDNASKSIVEPQSNKGPPGAFHMPGLSGLNMNSLKKKHQKITTGAAAAPSDEKIPEEKGPDWKKNLLRNRGSTKSMSQKTPTKTGSEPEKLADAPWMKEMKDKGKSFVKKDAPKQEYQENEYQQPPPVEPVKPSASIRSKESFKQEFQHNNVSSSSSFNTPSLTSTISNEQNYTVQTPAPATRPVPVKQHPPHQVVASQRTSSLGLSSPAPPKEPTLADVASELKKLRGQVQVLSLRLDEETEKRKALEVKIRSLQRT